MSDDIVTRLRRHSHTEYPMGDGQVFRLKMPVLSEAADEIERLRLACHYLAGWLSYHGVEPKEAVKIAYEKAVGYE